MGLSKSFSTRLSLNKHEAIIGILTLLDEVTANNDTWFILPPPINSQNVHWANNWRHLLVTSSEREDKRTYCGNLCTLVQPARRINHDFWTRIMPPLHVLNKAETVADVSDFCFFNQRGYPLCVGLTTVMPAYIHPGCQPNSASVPLREFPDRFKD